MGRHLNHANGREHVTRSGTRKEQKSVKKSKGASRNITQGPLEKHESEARVWPN